VQREAEPTPLLEAHDALGTMLFHLGEYAASWTHIEQHIALTDPMSQRVLVFRHDVLPRVRCLAVVADTLSCLGYPAQAVQRQQEALALAQSLTHPIVWRRPTVELSPDSYRSGVAARCRGCDGRCGGMSQLRRPGVAAGSREDESGGAVLQCCRGAGFHQVHAPDSRPRCRPAVRRAEAGTLIVADGFSCQEQIVQATGKRPTHLAQVIQLARRDQQRGAAAAR
jgi:hypothetical protein